MRGQIVVQCVSEREQSFFFFQSHVSGFLINLLFGVVEPASKSSKRNNRQQGPHQLTKNEGSRLR